MKLNVLRKGVAPSVFAAAIALTTAGCANSGFGCPAFVPVPQPVQLLYPLANASGVPANAGVILYAASPPVPITLSQGATSIATQPANLPSPLPSPMATPEPGLQVFAASVGPLSAHTTYAVIATAAMDGCLGITHVPVTIGTFTTL
jgi:hypothetical protein